MTVAVATKLPYITLKRMEEIYEMYCFKRTYPVSKFSIVSYLWDDEHYYLIGESRKRSTPLITSIELEKCYLKHKNRSTTKREVVRVLYEICNKRVDRCRQAYAV